MLWKLTRWFSRDWWRYLLAPMSRQYDDEPFWRLRIVWCRVGGHPAGVRFYSSGFEPDMHCKNCDDDLG